MKEKILIADDEEDILTMLKDYFEINDYEVFAVSCGEDAIKKISVNPDIILLDISMPETDGIEVCKKIRNSVSCPIIFLTARTEENDKITGFGCGADDYVVKPFSFDELGARVKAHLRRENRKFFSHNIKFSNGISVDYNEKCLYIGNTPVYFAKKEFEIIEFLSRNPGQIFDKETIYEKIWGFDSEGDNSVITEHIRRIRSKINYYGINNIIETVWGVGYKWKK